MCRVHHVIVCKSSYARINISITSSSEDISVRLKSRDGNEDIVLGKSMQHPLLVEPISAIDRVRLAINVTHGLRLHSEIQEKTHHSRNET